MADTKRMIHDAYGLFHLQREGGGGDPVSGRIYGMAKAVWAGKVMAAVENQPKPLGDLILMCYAPMWEARSLETVTRCLWGQFIKTAGENIKQDRTYRKARALAEVAVFNYQAQARGGPFTVETICHMAGIDRSHWYKPERHWRRWFETMGRILYRWEHEGMRIPDTVCEEIASLRQIEREKMAAS